MSQRMSERWLDPEFREAAIEKMRIARVRHWDDPERKRKMIECQREGWRRKKNER